MMNVEKAVELSGHKDAVYCFFSAGAPHLFFSAGGDGMIVKWDVSAAEPTGTLVAQLPTAIYSAVYLQEENLLVAGTRFGGLHVLDLNNKTEKHKLELKGDVFALQVLPGNKLAAVCAAGHFYVIDTKHFSVEQYMQPTPQNGRVLALSPDNKLLASGWSDGNIRVYNTEDMALIHDFYAHEKSVFALLFTDDNKLISGGRDAQLRVWNTANFANEKIIPAHMFTVNKLIYSPSKKYFASASRDKTIKIWDTKTFELIKVIDRPKFAAHTHSVNALWWPDYKNYLISGGDDKIINTWQLNFTNNPPE